MHADVVGGNTEPEEKFGAELYVRMHACMRLNVERKRTEVCVCVCVCEGKRSCTMALCIMTTKKGTTLLHTLPEGSVHAHIPTAQCDNNRNCV